MSSEDKSAAGPSRKRNLTPSSSPQPGVSSLNSNFSKEYIRTKFQLYLEIGERNLQIEAHTKRLQNLRKELTFIKNTDWQYDPPVGQT